MILSPDFINRDAHPILYNVAVSFDKFRSAFDRENDNYKKSYLYFNPIIVRNRADNRKLDKNVFLQAPPIDEVALSGLRFLDVFGEHPLILEAINGLGLNMNLNTYLRVISSCSNHKSSLKNTRSTNGTSLCMKDFFKTFKKGLRSLRKVLLRNHKNSIVLGGLRQVKKYLSLVDLPYAENCTQIRLLYESWGYDYLDNKFQDFLFKFSNNLLGLNVRTVHFTERINRGCTFYELRGVQNPPDETFVHLFF
jgi:hypothetical protein